ncbi:MAG: HEAT repeat domain-containing protein, partial [Planctomycetota bacterium]|nr:HEAT repeat domain-containing protein [Planctomycetota bacterium]
GARRPELAIDLKARTSHGGPDLERQRHPLTRSFGSGNLQWSVDRNTVRSRSQTVVRSPKGGQLIASQFPRSPNRFDPQAATRQETHAALRWDRGRRGTFAISRQHRANTLWGGSVFDVVDDPDHKRKWLCTDYGLTTLDEADRVTGVFTQADGLIHNRVTSGLLHAGKLYFGAAAASTEGGLIEFDAKKNVWTTRFESDGLATRKIAKLESHGDRLRVVYAGESGVGNNHHYRLCPPGEFAPKTGRVTSGGTPKGYGSSQWPKHLANLGDPAPVLGGHVLATRSIGNKSYIATSNGLLIVDADTSLPGLIAKVEAVELPVTLIVDPAEIQIAAAKAATISIRTPEELAKLLKSRNPYLRTRAYAMTWQRSFRVFSATINKADFIPVLVQAVGDPHVRARSTGLFVLSTLADASTIPAWKTALKDRDHRIRALAAMTLARLGGPPELSYFEELLTNEATSTPFGLESSISTGANREHVYAALAKIATPEVMRLLMQHPPSNRSDYDMTVFQPLGIVLRRHPEEIAGLLKANAPQHTSPSDRDYVRKLLAAAGSDILPQLHHALRDKDRVVRSNAARGCGAIGETSSIPQLIQALDLESGLSQASIVWALGELKADAAMPKLVTMYIDAKNDERRMQGGGFRASQAMAVYQAQYESIQDLQSLSRDWDKLHQTIGRETINPRENEELLTPGIILEAVRKIGVQAAQDFYRRLAAESDLTARLEASEQLAHAVDSDVAKNTPILRNLLADQNADVRVRSAASLLILGDTQVRSLVLEWLKSSNAFVRRSMLMQLMRVMDGGKLEFARDAIRSFNLTEQAVVRGKEVQTRDALLERIGSRRTTRLDREFPLGIPFLIDAEQARGRC